MLVFFEGYSTMSMLIGLPVVGPPPPPSPPKFGTQSLVLEPTSCNVSRCVLLLSGQAEDNMKKYGKSLVNAVPDKATKLLKVLCTDYRPQLLQEHKSSPEHFVSGEVCTATFTLRQALCSGTFIVHYNHQFQI